MEPTPDLPAPTYDEIALPPRMPLADAARRIETDADALGLRVTLRGTLAQHPGCIHWHFKQGKAPGTLEITLLNRQRRILMTVQSGRQGPWTAAAQEQLWQAFSAWPDPPAATSPAAPLAPTPR